MRLLLEFCSSIYKIKEFTEKDIPEIYELCKANTSYYKYMKMQPTLENVRENLTILPPGMTLEDKYFVGFYKDGTLVALLDLITHYPDSMTAYIGWFMVKKELQKAGVGARIIQELLYFLMESGFEYVKLGCTRENQEAQNFWASNGFYLSGSEQKTEAYTILGMERQLIWHRPMA